MFKVFFALRKIYLLSKLLRNFYNKLISLSPYQLLFSCRYCFGSSQTLRSWKDVLFSDFLYIDFFIFLSYTTTENQNTSEKQLLPNWKRKSGSSNSLIFRFFHLTSVIIYFMYFTKFFKNYKGKEFPK